MLLSLPRLFSLPARAGSFRFFLCSIHGRPSIVSPFFSVKGITICPARTNAAAAHEDADQPASGESSVRRKRLRTSEPGGPPQRQKHKAATTDGRRDVENERQKKKKTRAEQKETDTRADSDQRTDRIIDLYVPQGIMALVVCISHS